MVLRVVTNPCSFRWSRCSDNVQTKPLVFTEYVNSHTIILYTNATGRGVFYVPHAEPDAAIEWHSSSSSTVSPSRAVRCSFKTSPICRPPPRPVSPHGYGSRVETSVARHRNARSLAVGFWRDDLKTVFLICGILRSSSHVTGTGNRSARWLRYTYRTRSLC